MSEERRLRVTQVKSAIGYHKSQKENLRTMGVRRLRQTVELPDTPTVRGMVRKIAHLVQVEEVAESC
jgi:large subunit ribosomal protein L30